MYYLYTHDINVYFLINDLMNIKNLLLACSITAVNTSCSPWNPPKDINSRTIPIKTEQTIWNPHTSEWMISLQDANNISDQKDSKNANTKDQIFICLKKDGEKSFTYTNTLESIDDPDSSILEFPISHLFQKYWDKSHPLQVRWVSRTLGSLLWKNAVEKQYASINQKFNKRTESIGSSTMYEVGDTLRFKLINPELKWQFPSHLSDQLKEKWFQNFTNDAFIPSIQVLDLSNNPLNSKQNKSFIYDIVVKRLEDWRSALALYRNWNLFMASYVSVWLNNRKTKVWQFKILWKYPYYRSRKYRSPMPNWLKFDEWGYFFHQWNVTWYPASHGCVRLPWIYALWLYSLVKNSEHVDVFIDTNLYKSTTN